MNKKIFNFHIFNLLDSRFCLYLKRARPWLEFRIKSSFQSQYKVFPESIWWDLIIFECFVFRQFNWVSMYKIPSLPFQMESWARSLGGCRWNHIVFQFTYDIFCNSMYLTYAHNLDSKVRFKIIFLPLKESVLMFQVWIFLSCLHLFCLNWSYWVSKTNSKYFGGELWPFYFPRLISSIFISSRQ